MSDSVWIVDETLQSILAPLHRHNRHPAWVQRSNEETKYGESGTSQASTDLPRHACTSLPVTGGKEELPLSEASAKLWESNCKLWKIYI